MGGIINAINRLVEKVAELVSATKPVSYAVDLGATDAYAITLSATQSLVTGMMIVFKANTANTTAATLNVNGTGAVALNKRLNTALATGDILAGMLCVCVYDGATWILINPVVN